MTIDTPPVPAATYERARRLANVAMWTIEMQRRRLRSREPEDGEFLFRRWADFQFLIVALTRIRRAAVLASKVDGLKDCMSTAVKAFDDALPNLRTMRNAAEHIDDYALDSGNNKAISRRSLEVATVNNAELSWLPDDDGGLMTLNADDAVVAAAELFEAIKSARALLTSPKRAAQLPP